MKPRVIVLEDEPDIAVLIAQALEREGLAVERFEDGAEGLKAVQARRPDLLVLDLMIPGLDGLSVCRELRRERGTRDLPILIVSARSEEADVVCGLELGADDYVTKPFSPRVLAARAKNLLRRTPGNAGEAGKGDHLIVGNIELDLPRFEVKVKGERVEMTRTEFRILQYLISKPGRVRARNEILEFVEGGPSLDRTVDVHIASLRRKLGADGDLIETVRGVGYRMRD
jgi:two-component system, OmpR family, alkaline phosphatase synthesis response regulator PhoP